MDEVQPHDASLKSYLRHSFPSVRDVEDVVQESYLRLLETRATAGIRSARAFLFSVAKRLAIDVIRRERRQARHTVPDVPQALDVPAPGADVAERVSRDEEIALLAAAIHALPQACRRIMILRKLDGLSHAEIAARLGISVSTVEVQIGRGMEKCAQFLRQRGDGRRERRQDHGT